MSVPSPDPVRPPRGREAMHDVTAEPQFSARPESPPMDPVEPLPGARNGATAEESMSVWDEPTTARELAGSPEADAVTYASWLAEGQRRTTWGRSWLTVLLVSLAAGPWGVIGAFSGSMGFAHRLFGMLAAVFLAPVVEEIAKTAIAQTILEIRPFLFKHPAQILLVGLAGGLSFAVIENLIYLHVLIDEPTRGLILWRWTVCVAMHMGCSAVASLGLALAWRDGMRHHRRPRIIEAFHWLVFAMVGHGAYNAFAIAWSALGGAFPGDPAGG